MVLFRLGITTVILDFEAPHPMTNTFKDHNMKVLIALSLMISSSTAMASMASSGQEVQTGGDPGYWSYSDETAKNVARSDAKDEARKMCPNGLLYGSEKYSQWKKYGNDKSSIDKAKRDVARYSVVINAICK